VTEFFGVKNLIRLEEIYLIEDWVMSKEQKGNKESKKTKNVSEETKKQKKEKKDPKRHDGPAK
jgi:hypothetical protein